MDSEHQLVERTARLVPSGIGSGAGSLRVGIGDDAAVFAPRAGSEWVVSCDAFLEGVHFLARSHPPDSIGYKSLVRATSDLAAMGATPRLFLTTLALPKNRTGAWLDSFLRGMGRAARAMNMRLAGGDTTRSPAVFISITVLGEIIKGRAVTRGGAHPGDLVYVSGKLGRAELGLELVRRGLASDRRFQRTLRPHLYPQIRIGLGEWLARRRLASAMMDISDGLSTDLERLCAASRVGARIWSERIPCVKIPWAVTQRLQKVKFNPLEMALHGGDDYELLFTVRPGDVKRLKHAPGFRALAQIGVITRNRQIAVVSRDGANKPLRALGWDPFRK